MFRFVKTIVIIVLAGMLACQTPEKNQIVKFPAVEGPIAITKGPQEHLFASYYGINSWSANQKYATVLQTPIKYTLPTKEDDAVLGLVDMDTYDFIPLTETRAWNFQQGCMAHWLATSPDSLIIYNDLVDGSYVSIIMNVHTKEKIKTIPYPVSAVSPNGKEAICINFSRLRITRTAYGYDGDGQDNRGSVQFPQDDGLFLVDLETGKAKMLISIADIKDQVPELVPGQREYFNHTLFSRDGSKIFWLARSNPNPRNTTSFVINRDGSGLVRCFPDGWGGSHFDWLDGDNLMITAAYDAQVYGHILFTVGQDNYKRLGNGILDYDGHGAFSPDGNWMITDTYPKNKLQEQCIYLMDMQTEAVLPLGRFINPVEFRKNGKDAACDLHPRWSPDGNIIGFNSVDTGSRQVYIYKFQF